MIGRPMTISTTLRAVAVDVIRVGIDPGLPHNVNAVRAAVARGGQGGGVTDAAFGTSGRLKSASVSFQLSHRPGSTTL